MPAIPKIRSIEFLSPLPDPQVPGGADIRADLEDGSASSFGVLTPDHVAARMNEAGQDFGYGSPVLFVKRVEPECLGRAVEAMAQDMSGFWLRYYNSKPQAPAAKARPGVRKGGKK
ncbi:MAG: hypothetical protein WC881_01005 [Elusimicrobiota bacterium]|jgi:hypothetical protein